MDRLPLTKDEIKPGCILNAFIEIHAGSKVKYEWCKEAGMLKVDRILYSSVVYPHNYGFFNHTLAADGDAIDVLVLCQVPVIPGCYMRVKPIGMLEMIDDGEEDYKVIAVHQDDPEWNSYDSINELHEHRKKEISTFFREYKNNEGKNVEIGEYQDVEATCAYIRAGVKNCSKK